MIVRVVGWLLGLLVQLGIACALDSIDTVRRSAAVVDRARRWMEIPALDGVSP